MVANAVTKAWRKSLEDPTSVAGADRLLPDGERPPTSPHGWHRPNAADPAHHALSEQETAALRHPANDAGDDDLETRRDRRDDIVPRRVAVSSVDQPEDGFWRSHEFWMGIVIGAAVVFVIKTVLAVRAPFGVDWHPF